MFIKKRQLFISLIYLFFLRMFSFAAIIPDDPQNPNDGWKDARAYRPSPVVFSHGFASGGPLETWVEREKQKESEKPKLDEKLEPYFRNYYYGHLDLITQEPIKALQYSRFPYLELVSYIDFSKSKRSQLIDRNSSIDTYKIEDYYVYNYEREPGDPGWADKLNDAVEKIRENYTDSNGYPMKINLVCHSMGGLTAREYITNSKYGNSQDNVKKVIMVGVPNLGSPWASLADGLTAGQKAGWFLPWIGWVCSSAVAGIDRVAEETGMMDADGDAARDMDAGILGSGFLKGLNNRVQPPGVEYYVIWGNNRSFKDRVISSVMYHGVGDGVVSKDSQLGTGVLNLKGAVEITASHGTEALEISKLEAMGAEQGEKAEPLLKFVDSSKPEVKITFPDADKTTEIYENTIIIKGEVRKEYFPADSILKIDIVRQEDGNSEPAIAGKLLYPSDLWVPGDSDSVIAEFEEEITFSQEGTYKISCEVENPAGIHSDKKEVRVKVVKVPGTNIIIHCHSPEGKEINSISNAGFGVKVYDGDNLIEIGGYNLRRYNKPVAVSAGRHKIRAEYNGMIKEQEVDIRDNETKTTVFTFERVAEIALVSPKINRVVKVSGVHQPEDGRIIFKDLDDNAGYESVEFLMEGASLVNYSVVSEMSLNNWNWEVDLNYVVDFLDSDINIYGIVGEAVLEKEILTLPVNPNIKFWVIEMLPKGKFPEIWVDNFRFGYNVVSADVEHKIILRYYKIMRGGWSGTELINNYLNGFYSESGSMEMKISSIAYDIEGWGI